MKFRLAWIAALIVSLGAGCASQGHPGPPGPAGGPKPGTTGTETPPNSNPPPSTPPPAPTVTPASL
jgi:hypothetical protein